jgi:LacI family transcriptional regulator, galactose operon repressor
VTPRVRAAGAASGSGISPAARTGLLGVLVPLVDDIYFSAILAGIAEGAYQHELRPVLSPTQHEHAREVSLLDRLLRGVVDGAVLVLPEASSDELKRAQVEGPPFVVIDPLLPLDVGLPCITVANRSGAEQAMRHLVALGHRRIAAITGPPGWVATEGRRSGYRAVLEAAGVPLEPALEVEADFQIGPGAEAAATLLDLPEPPTAIFAFNDAIAVGAMRAARERGLRLPEDLSIVGYDDVTVATIVAPALTTVRQPLAEMGRTAVNLLVRLLDGRHEGTQQIELPTRLVVRQSTAPPPGSLPVGR